MFVYFVVFLRILSNSLANLYQKKSAETSSAICINLYSYMFMSLICLIPAIFIDWTRFSFEFWGYVVLAGFLCTVGTIALIEALKIGELSELAPINSYKAIIGLLSAFILLHETPSLKESICVILIVFGSYFVLDNENLRFSIKTFVRKDIILRFFALFCTGIEAAILKKIIIMSNYYTSLILWSFSGFLCSLFCFVILKPLKKEISNQGFYNIIIIAFMLLIMQLSTNYVFSKLNVGISLALFQLSSLVALYFGYKVFNEKNIIKKLIGTIIMLIGSTIVVLS